MKLTKINYRSLESPESNLWPVQLEAWREVETKITASLSAGTCTTVTLDGVLFYVHKYHSGTFGINRYR